MITVLAILIGVVFIYVGLKKKFFVMWAMLFNLLVSFFLSVMLVHLISKITPEIGNNAYFLALLLLVLAALFYAILHIITKFYIIGSNAIELPILFDKIGAGLLGFVFGFLTCSFVLFAVGVMPIAKHEFMTNVLGDKTLASIAAIPVKKACSFTGYASRQCYPKIGDDVTDWLMTLSELQETPVLKSGSARDDIAEELAGDDFGIDDYPTEKIDEVQPEVETQPIEDSTENDLEIDDQFIEEYDEEFDLEN
jgi:hypothetical protein